MTFPLDVFLNMFLIFCTLSEKRSKIPPWPSCAAKFYILFSKIRLVIGGWIMDAVIVLYWVLSHC